MKTLALLCCVFLAPAALAAPRLVCHYDYGGETHILSQARLKRAQDADGIAATHIGSYLMFRPVFEPDEIKLYTYADHPDGPVLLHQARYLWPADTRSRGRFGFTGEQRVYEPIRDSELTYWCEVRP